MVIKSVKSVHKVNFKVDNLSYVSQAKDYASVHMQYSMLHAYI